MHPQNAAQLAAFPALSAGEQRAPRGLAVLAMTGMRRGELLALRWGDIDQQTGTIAVHVPDVCDAAVCIGEPGRERDRKGRALGVAAHAGEQRYPDRSGRLMEAVNGGEVIVGVVVVRFQIMN